MIRFEYPFPETVGTPNGPAAFDPAGNGRHRELLDRKIAAWQRKHPAASAATLEFIDMDRHVAVLADRTSSSVDTRDNGSKEVRLSAEQSRPSRGNDVRAVYEGKYPGYYLTVFHPYDSYALLERLTDRQVAVRAQIAVELGLNEWDLRVDETDEGGWRVRLDDGITYQPSKMDARMDKACLTVGRLGWWFDADPDTGVIVLHPGEPRTFPKTVPFPFDRIGDPRVRDRTPFGVQLARPGEPAEPALVDWTQSLGLLVAGLSGGGKSVTINDIVTLAVGTGAELYVIDHSTKATDYYWCRPWVADRGWGADSLLQTAGLLKWLLDDIEDGGGRAKAWKEHGWQSWYDDLSDEDKRRHPYRLIVIDELSQLTVGAKDANSLPKNPLPPVMERMFEQQVKALILSTLIRILQIGRAYGYRVVVATQIASSTTGMPPALRGNLGNKLIMGAKVNDAQKNLIFNIARDVPDIPENVIAEGVSKGAGLSEFEGQPPYDFKSAFPILDGRAGVAALGAALADRIGLPDGIGRAGYMDSLDKSTPSDPGFEEKVMARIRFPEKEAYQRFPFLRAIKDKWDEALDSYGGGAAGRATDADDGDDAAPAPAAAPAGAPIAPSGPLMDAAELARIMRAG